MTTSQPPKETARHASTGYGFVIPGVEVVRHGRVEPFLHARPTLTSTAAQWAGLALEGFSVPACVIPRHEHIENFLHVVLSGPVKYEVLTRGKALRFGAVPGTTFVLPRGTVDELRWEGPTRRIAVAIHTRLLINELDENAHASDIALVDMLTVDDLCSSSMHRLRAAVGRTDASHRRRDPPQPVDQRAGRNRSRERCRVG